MQLFFYELHEGATDLMTDALLVAERDHTPEEFASMVRAARAVMERWQHPYYWAPFVLYANV